MVSNDEKIINKSEKFSLLNIYSQTQINKLIKTVMNAEKLTFGSLCEIINKLSLDNKSILELLKNIFVNSIQPKDNKVQFMLYTIIIKNNKYFFEWFNDHIQGETKFNEEQFLLKQYNDALTHIEMNSQYEFIFFNYVNMISFFVLKFKYKFKYNENDIAILSNKVDKYRPHSQLFYSIYSTCLNYNDIIEYISSYDILSPIVEAYIKTNLNEISNTSIEYHFNESKISYFLLFTTRPLSFPLPLPSVSDNEFYFLGYQSEIRAKIQSLCSYKDILTKILLYGPKSSGKASFAKTLLSSPLIIEVDDTIETSYLVGGYLINEFSEIIWQDGILLSALKEGRDILLLSMEKCGNDLLSLLKQILEKNSLFVLAKQEEIKNFSSKVVLVYNTASTDIQEDNLIFSFLKSNTFSFQFNQYTNEDIMNICEFRYSLSQPQKDLLSRLIKVYNSIPSKVKINSRYRKITLNNIISFAKIIKQFYIDNNIEDFINEKLLMKIVCEFIYHTLLSIDDNETLSHIGDLLSLEFNFASSHFNDFTFNIESKFAFDNEFSYVTDFDNSQIRFDALPKGNFYSYNTNSKFYIKLINEKLMERNNILLVGETGVGKTRMIQNLANIMNVKLNVINLSQSSDESDLFGGFKPVSMKHFLQKYFEEINMIINKYFDAEKNTKFVTAMYNAFKSKNEKVFVNFCIGALDKISKNVNEENEELKLQIEKMSMELIKIKKLFENSTRKSENAFKYIEGILLQAIRNDEWILLDEINLANDDVLLKIKSILEGESVFIMSNNEICEYKKQKHFRIFGSMNPEYNIGKKRLPSEIREFFYEIFIKEINQYSDIKNFICEYVNDIPQIQPKHIELIANFYIEIKKLSNANTIYKSNGLKCNFSLRTLTRSLISLRNAAKKFTNIDIAIYEAISMNFNSQIDKSCLSKLSIQYPSSQLKEVCDVISIAESNHNSNFVLTDMFKSHLNTLIQIVFLSNYAVLLEGPTSCGKTSIVEFLARCLNQKILRINNNQNTEVEEYIGAYTADSNGKFYFKEGFLVKAVREGMWIILDEINLAPSEVLEALNRLLDDNRELYLPESNTVIKAHDNFRIFAAMNPSESYAGRKDLSDAFKNRFIHLFFDNIPSNELITIIEKRCKLPRSRCEIMINIFSELQMIRSKEQVFQRNEGFITIRDLIKWGMRDIDSYEKLAIEGYVLLAEKLRSNDEKNTVKMVIENALKSKNIKLSNDYINEYYANYYKNNLYLFDNVNIKIKITQSMCRILTLVHKALTNHEPVLLIGDTGTGKTLSVEYLRVIFSQNLITINCHENMDTNDFLGNLRSVPHSSSLFEWVDGPLTSAMKNGDMLLIDEIALVMDSVLERMNSVFEADSVLVLSEKNIDDNVEVIYPNANFKVVAAMTPPKGEYNKKELSNALRARFTEIYIGELNNDDIKDIILHSTLRINQIKEDNAKLLAIKLFDIYTYYNSLKQIAKPITLRDIDMICEFIEVNYSKFDTFDDLFHNAISMTIIEGLYLNESLTPMILAKLKQEILSKTQNESMISNNKELSLIDNETHFGINNFLLNKNKTQSENMNESEMFVFDTKTLKSNLLKILRGMSVNKPILIEGSPGVGKTTLVQNIAKKINKKIHRVNLSEHTDMIDLIGSQYPSSDTKAKFKWIDGVLLTAIKNGDWIIIDEMNLANQNVLEGLNGLLETKTIFVSELNTNFTASKGFQIFATQNPVHQGGGRKFLPKSFLNRFIKIYIDDLTDDDYEKILNKMQNKFDDKFIKCLVSFNSYAKKIVIDDKIPLSEIGEFNLRTMIKFIHCVDKGFPLITVANTLYIGRFRNMQTRSTLHIEFISLFSEYLPKKEKSDICEYTSYNDEIEMCIQCGFPIIIAGKANIGKKHLLRAFHSKRKIFNEFFLYSTMDSSELLGNFDKSNELYKLRIAKRQLGSVISQYSLNDAIKALTTLIDVNNSKINDTTNIFDFEWHDSILIQSIINGDLLLLDNVNTCSASVLDRLNSLLDDDNAIYLSECGENRAISANKDFRLFMTMNISYGEVSRALKNRCVELYYIGKLYQKRISSNISNINSSLFSISGNCDVVEISLCDYCSIRIQYDLLCDMILFVNMMYWFSFDICMIYFTFINEESDKVNFRTFSKFTSLTIYYYQQCKYDEIEAFFKSTNVFTKKDKKDIIRIIENVHRYFINFDIKKEANAINIILYLKYHLNAEFNQNAIVNISEIIAKVNSISSNMRTIASDNFIFTKCLFEKFNFEEISNKIKENMNVITSNENNSAMLYQIYKKSKNLNVTRQIKERFNYSFDELKESNIKSHLKMISQFDSYENQMRKLISIDYEQILSNELNLIINNENSNFDDFHTKIYYLISLVNKNANVIRNNSELFIFIIQYVISKYMNENKKEKRKKKDKKLKVKLLSNQQLSLFAHDYDSYKLFSINNDILCLHLNFPFKTISFSSYDMNKAFLRKIFSELNDTTSIETGMLPLITHNEDLKHIQQLISEFYSNVNIISDNDLNLIHNLINLSSPIEFDDKSEKFYAKFISQSIFCFIKSSLNYKSENNIQQCITLDLLRLIIIDELKTNIKDKFCISNDEITYDIINVIKQHKNLLYIYPYIYFYIKNAYESIANAIDVIFEVLHFDIKSYCNSLISKYANLFECNEEDANELIKQFAPSKESVYKIIGKNMIKQFHNERLNTYNRFDFAYQFVNGKCNDEYKNKIEDIQNKLNKYNTDDNDDSNTNERNSSNIIERFICEVNEIKENVMSDNVNKVKVKKFIDDYLLHFCDIILPFTFFSYIKAIIGNEKKNKEYESEGIIFNPSNDKEKIMKRMNVIESNEMKMEYLIKIVNEYNYKVIIEIYNELFDNNVGGNKETSLDVAKIKQYVSFEEKVMEQTRVIGEMNKDEKDKIEKEEENKEIEEKFPLYANQFNIYAKNNDLLPDDNMNVHDMNNNNQHQIKTQLSHIQLFEFLCKVNKIPLNISLTSSNINSSNDNWYTFIKDLTKSQGISIHNLLHINYTFFKSHSLTEQTVPEYTTSTSFEVSKPMSTFNFYHDPNPTEAKLLYIPLNTIISKCRNYLITYPDHPVLVTIIFICNSILSLDISITPLSKLLSGLDILLNKLHEWELYSSKKINSLQGDIENIMRVIRHYRKIEVFSWKHFLISKEREIVQNDINETFCEMYFKRNTLLEQVDFVNYFVMSSNIGNFNYRLNLMKLLSLTCDDKGLCNVMNNLYMYYMMNYVKSGKYDKFKSDKIEEIDTKIKSLIKIAKWDIKNYFNFRDNMKRNYKQLNKLLKENENIFVTYKLVDIIKSAKSDYENKNFVFEKLVAPFQEENEEEQYEIVYDVYNNEIFDRIKTLKSLNVAGNTSKAFKQKALLDLIKKMRNLGMSKNYKFIQNEIYEKFKTISLQSNSTSAYICKLLEKINNFSNLKVSQYTDQLNSNYFDQMKGISFSLFDKCLLIFMEVEKLKNKYEKELNKKYIEILQKNNKAQIINENIRKVIEMIKNFICSIDITEIDLLFKEKTSLKHFIGKYNELKNKLNNLNSYLEICGENINDNGEIRGDIEYISHIIYEINEIINNDIMPAIKTDFNVMAYLYIDSSMELSLYIESIILKGQNISIVKTAPYKKMIENTVFTYEKQNIKETEKNDNPFNLYYIDSDNNNVDPATQPLDEDSDIFSVNKFITKLSSFTSSFSLPLHKISMVTIPQLIDIFMSILKLSNLTISIFYNITINGFCSQPETKGDSAPQEQGGVMEGGYGMADAKGVEDVTKEIEDEEQLLGLKEEKDGVEEGEPQNEQNEQGNEDKEDNGFEMKTDFKEDFKKEIDNDENDENKDKDNSSVEREEDDVENENNNKMYDEDNSLNDEEEKENEKEKKNKEIDLTDKNVQGENNKKNELKAKENEDKKDTAKDVDEDKENEKDNDEDSIMDSKQEKKKVEKLEVDKEKKENKEESNEEEIEQEEKERENDDQMSIENEDDNKQNQEEKESKENTSKDAENGNEDLMPEMEENKYNQEQNEEDKANSEENENSSQSGINNEKMNNSMSIEDEEENSKEDAHFKSNPMTSTQNDLGYNPLTKNKGNTGSNTAKNTKEELKEQEDQQEEENKAPDVEQLKDLDQFKEIFDINSILDSVWTTRPNQQFNKKNNNQDKVNIQNNEQHIEENVDMDEKIEENFKFENYKDEQQQNNNNIQGGFTQGYASKDQQNKEDEVAKGNSDFNKRNINENKQKEKEDEKMEEDIDNNNRENIESKEPIKIYENDKNAEIFGNENEMEVENEEQENEEKENLNEDNENDEKSESKSKMSVDENNNIITENQEKPMNPITKVNTEQNEQPTETNPEDATIMPIPELELSSTISTFNTWIKSPSSSSSLSLLSQFESISQAQILKLTELLKIALEPNKQSKLRGNYKTGKRLNMKKIINFIASNYRQDKIWLRRTLPHERDYFITIAIDDSLSMKEHNLGFFALQSLIILSSALSKVNIAKISVCAIENEMHLLNSFDESLSKEKLAFILSHFKFDFSSKTSHDFAMMNFMAQSMKMIENASFSGNMVNQIVFIISDGRFNKKNCKALCAQAKEKGLLYVFIILDQYGIDNKNSIINTMTVEMEDMSVKPYLEDFPFQYYVIVQDPADLPEVVQMILIKWFEGTN